jgi:hypothetical protein
MADLQVERCPPTAENRLYHSHNGCWERVVLTLVSIQLVQRSYKIKLGGLALLHVDADHALRRVEVRIGRANLHLAPPPDLPDPIPAAGLVFVNLVGAGEPVEWPAKIVTDSRRSFAYIVLGAQSAPLEWVALSDHVFGASTNGYFHGFYVRLPVAWPVGGHVECAQ